MDEENNGGCAKMDLMCWGVASIIILLFLGDMMNKISGQYEGYDTFTTKYTIQQYPDCCEEGNDTFIDAAMFLSQSE